MAPQFTGTDAITNKTVSLSDFNGKCVLLSFAGLTWCEPCQAEAPVLAAVAQSYPEPVQFLMVSVQDSASLAAAVQQFGITFPVLVSPGTDTAYQVDAVPTLYMLDKTHTITDVHVGIPDFNAADINAAILEALGSCDCSRTRPGISGYWAAVIYIIFGVIQDGGGLGRTPSGHPVPVDPLRGLGPAGRDALLALATAELSTQMADRAQGIAIRNTALTAAKASIDALLAGRAAPGAGAGLATVFKNRSALPRSG
jgi:thiol-disulfide isomerase/thioredoxin